MLPDFLAPTLCFAHIDCRLLDLFHRHATQWNDDDATPDAVDEVVRKHLQQAPQSGLIGRPSKEQHIAAPTEENGQARQVRFDIVLRDACFLGNSPWTNAGSAERYAGGPGSDEFELAARLLRTSSHSNGHRPFSFLKFVAHASSASHFSSPLSLHACETTHDQIDERPIARRRRAREATLIELG